ncbi:MAG: cytidine deaminase [Flavobacteriales bacterium]|nr:MAG: cytidine deaminase [Flavobacteriales bacterium]
MKKAVEFIAKVEEMDSFEALNKQEKQLLTKAQEVTDSAYAPYSKFHVGAAILLENGEIVIGNNQENVAYPSGLCAERVAAFSASSQYPNVPLRAIAIFAKSKNFVVKNTPAPCGACRQVLAEYEHKQGSDIQLILKGEKGKILVSENVRNLLPFLFIEDELKKD